MAFSLLAPSSMVVERQTHVQWIYPADAPIGATPQSSTVFVGQLHDKISPSAKAALGELGVQRLESFMQLRAGWDGPDSRAIRLESIEVFSQFFADTALHPKQMGVFMSAEGNIVVNWLDQGGQLVELEFDPKGINYFIEDGGKEDTVFAGDLGFSGVSHFFKSHMVV